MLQLVASILLMYTVVFSAGLWAQRRRRLITQTDTTTTGS